MEFRINVDHDCRHENNALYQTEKGNMSTANTGQKRLQCPAICNTEEIRKLTDHPICLRFTGPGRGRLKRNNFVETAKYRSCI